MIVKYICFFAIWRCDMGKKHFFRELKEILIWAGVIVGGGIGGAGGMKLAFDAQESHFANMSQGLPLLKAGAHIKQGNHNVVITDQFFNVLSYNAPQEDQDFAINGIKESYFTLNKYNSKLNFNLCTTVDQVAKRYDIPKIKSIGKQDIPLYATDGILEGSKYVLAKTDWSLDNFTYQMKKLSITYRADALYAYNMAYSTKEETFNPKNATIYAISLHESMHAMGFAHNNKNRTIMNTYLSLSSPKDLTEYDIEMLDKYNVQFYGASPTIQSNQATTNEDEIGL